MKSVIAFVALVAFVLMFAGSALGIWFFGYETGLRISISSFLILILCLALDQIEDK